MCVNMPYNNIVWFISGMIGVDSRAMVLERTRSCWGNQIVVRMCCPLLQCTKSIFLLRTCASKVQLTFSLVDSDGTACGQFERIYSDHCDYVSTSAFDGMCYPSFVMYNPHHSPHPSPAVIPVKKLIEIDIDQPFIDRDDFYQRYTFEYKARIIDVCPSIAQTPT
jgi:hypothetical protein